MTAVRVRRRPTEHDAILYTGTNCYDVAVFLRYPADEAAAFAPDVHECSGDEDWIVETLHGPVDVAPGTWIIRGGRDCWPVQADQFDETYEVLQ